MSNLTFAPGETNVTSSKFSPSVILFWLKTEIATTNMRVVTKAPNTLLGLIPLGYKDATYPLKNIAGVGVEVKFSLGRAFFGLVFFIIGLTMMDNPFGWILFLLGLSMILNSMSSVLKMQNNGGSVSEVRVSILEKSKLEQLRSEINDRLFADHDGMRHQESMNVGHASLLNQQAALHLQQQQAAAAAYVQPAPPVQQPGQTGL